MKRNLMTRVTAFGIVTVLTTVMLTGCRFGFASDPDDPNEVEKEIPIDTSVGSSGSLANPNLHPVSVTAASAVTTPNAVTLVISFLFMTIPPDFLHSLHIYKTTITG